MDLQILNNKGVFEIHGYFTKGNTDKVKKYFNHLLDTYYEIVICLKQVKEIDNSALSVMWFISEKANKRSKTLFVLGENNIQIATKFRQANLNYIFKNDYTC